MKLMTVKEQIIQAAEEAADKHDFLDRLEDIIPDDLKVKNHCKNLVQTGKILNRNPRQIRRYLDVGRLEWAAENQVSVRSIIAMLQERPEHSDKSPEEIERELVNPKKTRRHSQSRRSARSFVKDF
jgi:hypothetical protein